MLESIIPILSFQITHPLMAVLSTLLVLSILFLLVRYEYKKLARETDELLRQIDDPSFTELMNESRHGVRK